MIDAKHHTGIIESLKATIREAKEKRQNNGRLHIARFRNIRAFIKGARMAQARASHEQRQELGRYITQLEAVLGIDYIAITAERNEPIAQLIWSDWTADMHLRAALRLIQERVEARINAIFGITTTK